MIAPLKGELNTPEKIKTYYTRTMSTTAFSGIGQLPELSLPVATVNGAPVGLSLVAAHREDEFLLAGAKQLFTHLS
jgi:amidase